jgi:hypothetical protein
MKYQYGLSRLTKCLILSLIFNYNNVVSRVERKTFVLENKLLTSVRQSLSSG